MLNTTMIMLKDNEKIALIMENYNSRNFVKNNCNKKRKNAKNESKIAITLIEMFEKG